jgi:septal ring-binding cell division protein DamX
MSRMKLGTVRAMTNFNLPARTLRTLLPLLVMALAACQSAQQKFDDAARSYDASNWQKAYDEATAAQNEAQPPLKQRAALYAGQAAYRMKRLDDAQARLAVAETSPEPSVAGQAKMVLGHVLVDANRPMDAKLKYLEAAQLLPTDLAAEARREADAAGALANPAAKTAVAAADAAGEDTAPAPPAKSGSKAKSKSSGKTKGDAKSKGKGGDSAKSGAKGKGDAATASAGKSSGGKSGATASKSGSDAKAGYTIQVGSFTKESDATKRAKELASAAKKAGLPTPEVKRVTGRDGKKVWVVTIGHFNSRADGKKALAKLKVDHAEVMPASGSTKSKSKGSTAKA